MNYSECMLYLEEINNRKGMVMGTAPVAGVLKRLGNPEKYTKIIHVAGTNGKGSVSAFLAEILSRAGCKVGRYVSPVISCYNEKVQRISAGSCCYIRDEEVAEYITVIRDIGDSEGLTQFEIETVMALLAFRDWQCDYAIVECGLGGLDDATNAIEEKEMCIFTSISMDHMAFLGSTITEIAAAKAGIIKKDVKVVSSIQKKEAAEVLEKYAADNNTVIRYAGECRNCVYDISGTEFYIGENKYHIKLPGVYQPANASTAVEAAKALADDTDNNITLSECLIDEALSLTCWNGRFEILSEMPYVIIDGAHNPDGIYMLKKSIEALFDREKYYRIGIMGVFCDKDVDGMVNIICNTFDEIHTVKAPSSRGMDADELAGMLEVSGCGTVSAHKNGTARMIADDVKSHRTASHKETVIIIFGSLSLYQM